jgi:hypothetical protein
MSKLAHFWSQYESPYLLISFIAQLKLMSNMTKLRSPIVIKYYLLKLTVDIEL